MAVNFSGSLVATGSIISTTGFTGSLSGTASNAATASSADNFLVRGTLTAQTINVQTITSSIDFVTGSSVNGSLLTNTHQFTGSVGITGSLAINGVDYNSTSASFDTRILNTSSSLATLSTNNAIASASFDTRINANSSSISQLSGSHLALSGSYLASSASFDTRIINNSASVAQLSGSYIASSASFDTRINTISSSYATTGSNIFRGNQTITGSFAVSGSTTQIGNNNLTGNTVLSGSVIVSGSLGVNASLVSIQGPLRLDPAPDPGTQNITASFLFTSASNTATGYDLYYRQSNNIVKFKWLEGGLSTGLLYGGVITYSGSTIFVSKGSGIINNLNASTGSEIAPIFNYVTWNDFTSSATYLTSSQNTFIYVDDTGAVKQQPSYFNPDQFREALPLGRVTHANYTAITGAGSNVQTTYDSDAQQNEFIRIFGPIKESGLLLSAQTGSMSLSIGAGQAYNFGGFYPQDPNHPSHYISSGFPTASIARAYRSGSAIRLDNNNGAFYTTVDSTNWDDGTGVLNSMASSEWQIQRVFVNPVTGRTVVYYGQTTYTTLLNAQQSLATDPFEEGEFTAKSLVFAGYLVIKGGTTNLADTGDNSVIQSGIFRGTQGSSGGAIISTTLDSLSDVAISTPSNYQALIYDGGIWINGNPASASYAATASFVAGVSNGTASFAATASNAISASFAATASSADNLTVRGTLTAQNIVVQTITSSIEFNTGSTKNGSLLTNTHEFTGSVGITGSLTVNAPLTITNNTSNNGLTFGNQNWVIGSAGVNGSTITYNGNVEFRLNAGQVGTPLLFQINNNTIMRITGSSNAVMLQSGGTFTDNGYRLQIQPAVSGALWVSGSTVFSGSVNAALGFTGSLQGTATTASFVQTAQTASYVLNAVSSSFATLAQTASFVTLAQTASFVTLAQTASFVTLAQTASFVQTAQTASYVLNAVSSSFATLAQTASFVQTAQTASFVQTAQTASYVLNTVSASFASTASSVNRLNQSVVISGSLTVSGSTNIIGTSGNTLVSSNADTLIFTGSLLTSGSIVSTGSLNILGGVTGSLFGTSSYAVQALSASYWSGSVTNAATASYVATAQTASSISQLNQNVIISGSLTVGSGSIGASENTLTLGARDAGGEGGQLGFNASGGTYTSASMLDLYQNKFRLLKGTNAGSTGEVLSANLHSGQIAFTFYQNASSFPGTAIANLAVDSGGNIITIAPGIVASASYAATASYVLNSVSSSFASTASYVLNAVSSSFASTASYGNNFIVGSTLTIDQTLTDYHVVPSSIAGSNNMFNLITGSYSSAFFKYTLTKGSNARTGEVMAVWNSGSIQYTDNSTLDIGDTSTVVASAVIASNAIQFNISTADSGWVLKSLGTFM
jgi:hypothetical protein